MSVGSLFELVFTQVDYQRAASYMLSWSLSLVSLALELQPRPWRRVIFIMLPPRHIREILGGRPTP